MGKLYQSKVFDCKSPKSLQRKVFFCIMYQLCRRGQENLRQIKVTDFVIKTAENGREYIEKVKDELTKNRRECDEPQEGGAIYETDFVDCPVKSFKKYLACLNPKVEYFFQRPKSKTPLSGPWFDAQVLGINTLGNLMKEISRDANLSIIYTNHSIRATAVTVLDNCGMEARHIMAVSGHKSEQSIRSYSRTSAGMKRVMSNQLNDYCHSKKPMISNSKVVQKPNYFSNIKKTFDFGLEISVSDADKVNDDKNDIINIENEQITASNFGSTDNLVGNQFSSLFGSAGYVEFSGCTFNFK